MNTVGSVKDPTIASKGTFKQNLNILITNVVQSKLESQSHMEKNLKNEQD